MIPSKRRILIIDDDSEVRESYGQILSSNAESDITSKGRELFDDQDEEIGPEPIRQYEVMLTDCGEAGVSAVREAVGCQRPFASAFIDMMMPGIDGAETAKQIWGIDPDIKIVIVTAYSDYTPDEIVRLVGREDLFYLRKPFNPAEIRQFARALTNQWELEREKELLSAKLARAREQEINTAAKIQQTLLLGQPPNNFEGIQLQLKTIPSQKVDGDFIDFIRAGDTSVDIIVGDVMGKGIPAALVGAALKSQLLRALNKLSQSGDARKIPEPENIVSLVQTSMIQQLEALETFVTLCYARFDLARNSIQYVDCGHTRTIHFQKEANTCRLLEGVNMPLGFPEKEGFTQIPISFKPGDLFVFYSDGLTEAKNAHAELYGEQRLVDVVRQYADLELDEMIEKIWQDVVGFTQSEIFTDDFTCIAARIAIKGPPGIVNSQEEDLEINSDLSQLARVREFVRNFCNDISQHRLALARVDLIELAVNEAVANIIKHAYREASDKRILIQACLSSNQLVFRLYDWGQSFDPASVPPPAFDATKDHGFGIYIIKQAVDELDYTRDENGRNCATLTINLGGGNPNAI